MIGNDPIFNNHLQHVGELALRNGLPSMFAYGSGLIEHGLVSYAHDNRQTQRSAAMMAVKIFKGAKPADIPFEQPTRFSFVVNLKTAKALGITIPQTVLIRADRVIE